MTFNKFERSTLCLYGIFCSREDAKKKHKSMNNQKEIKQERNLVKQLRDSYQ